jgi:hypothetical protein
MKSSPAVKMAIAAEYLSTMAGLTTVLGLASLAGLKIGIPDDWTSWDDIKKNLTDSTALKVNVWDDWWLDPAGGFSQWITFIARIALREKANRAGKTQSLTDNIKFGAKDLWDLISDKTRGMLNPAIANLIDVWGERDFKGNKVTFRERFGPVYDLGDVVDTGTAANKIPLPVPGTAFQSLAWQDTYQMFKEMPVELAIPSQFLTTFGWGLQHYDAKKSKKVAPPGMPP